MATAKLKTRETVELPFDEMLDFIARNPESLEKLPSTKPMPKRRSLVASNELVNSK